MCVRGRSRTMFELRYLLVSLSLYIFPLQLFFLVFFFFNDTATTEIYTLSLHDALPIYPWPDPSAHSTAYRRHWFDVQRAALPAPCRCAGHRICYAIHHARSEEHTSELQSQFRISYTVFCLKKKKTKKSLTQKKKQYLV